MSITLNNVLTNLNTYLGDSSEDRVSNAQRYEAMTEATVWLLEELGNEHAVNTYELEFLDTVNYYKVTSGLADFLVGGDLRREQGDQWLSFTRKSPRELAEEVTNSVKDDPSWGMERRDGDAYLVVSAQPKNIAKVVEAFDSVTGWTTDGDADNITLDNIEFKQGSGSLNFDIDVSASGVNSATVENLSFNTQDMSSYEDLGSFMMEVYIPDVSEITSYSLEWGTDASNYWVATVTTDIDGSALADGWNTLKLDWADASVVGSPDSGDIQHIAVTVNYGAGQGDDTDFRIDYLRLANPEKLTLHYVSWNVGTDTGGTDISAYTATTDIPFYSGAYDNYKYAVAHKAASMLFYSPLRLTQQGAVEESEAIKSLQRYQKNFESNKTREVKSFKVRGVNLRRRNRRRIR